MGGGRWPGPEPASPIWVQARGHRKAVAVYHSRVPVRWGRQPQTRWGRCPRSRRCVLDSPEGELPLRGRQEPCPRPSSSRAFLVPVRGAEGDATTLPAAGETPVRAVCSRSRLPLGPAPAELQGLRAARRPSPAEPAAASARRGAPSGCAGPAQPLPGVWPPRPPRARPRSCSARPSPPVSPAAASRPLSRRSRALGRLRPARPSLVAERGRGPRCPGRAVSAEHVLGRGRRCAASPRAVSFQQVRRGGPRGPRAARVGRPLSQGLSWSRSGRYDSGFPVVWNSPPPRAMSLGGLSGWDPVSAPRGRAGTLRLLGDGRERPAARLVSALRPGRLLSRSWVLPLRRPEPQGC